MIVKNYSHLKWGIANMWILPMVDAAYVVYRTRKMTITDGHVSEGCQLFLNSGRVCHQRGYTVLLQSIIETLLVLRYHQDLATQGIKILHTGDTETLDRWG